MQIWYDQNSNIQDYARSLKLIEDSKILRTAFKILKILEYLLKIFTRGGLVCPHTTQVESYDINLIILLTSFNK